MATAMATGYSSLTRTVRVQQQQQVRHNWQIFLQPVKDHNGEMKYPDWETVLRTQRFHEPEKHGKPLWVRNLQETRHIKPTEQRRRITSNKVYKRSKNRVEDLKSYIKFMRDHNTEEKK